MTHLVIYCDLGRTTGAGHLVRCTALGAAARDLGAEVTVAADFAEVPWARDRVTESGLVAAQFSSAAAYASYAAETADVALIDSYVATTADLGALAGIPLAAVDDEALRPLPTRLVVNQNLSAFECDYSQWKGAEILRGPEYALLRPQFRLARPAQYRERSWLNRPRRVLTVLGGTDARGSAAKLAARALAELAPIELRVIAATDQAAAQVRAQEVPAGSTLEPVPPMADIETAMEWADVVISAAGTTVWELCCVGVPMALVTVADNQVASAAHAAKAGISLPLGSIDNAIAGADQAWHELRDPNRANEIGVRAFATVDGLGARRVAQRLLALASV